MFFSRFMPCDECGASVDRFASEPHRCDPQRRLEYQLWILRDGIERLEDDMVAYLRTPAGKFESFLASRRVRRSA